MYVFQELCGKGEYCETEIPPGSEETPETGPTNVPGVDNEGTTPEAPDIEERVVTGEESIPEERVVVGQESDPVETSNEEPAKEEVTPVKEDITLEQQARQIATEVVDQIVDKVFQGKMIMLQF